MAKLRELSPDELRGRNTRRPQNNNSRASGSDDLDISEAEQMRLIRESGILKRIDSTPYFVQSVFFTLGLIIIFMVFQWSVYLQFGTVVTLSLDDAEFTGLLRRTMGAYPALLVIVYYTHKQKDKRWMQWVFFATAVVAGFQHLRIIMRPTNYHHVMLSPGIGTIWAYAVIQMDLLLAILSLLAVILLYFISMFIPEE